MTTPTPTTANAPAFAPRPSWIQGQVTFHETNHGPLPDVVATQGQHLVAQPHTPVFAPLRSEIHAFAAELAASLSALVSHQNSRRRGYGDEAAEEWPIGRTPPKVRRAQKERLRAKLRASLEEDSESDIEATLDAYYPLSPAPPASQGSATPPFIIESEPATAPRHAQTDSESDTKAKKRKLEQVEEENVYAVSTEHVAKKTKSRGTPGADGKTQSSLRQDVGPTDGVLEGLDRKAAPKPYSETGDGSSLQRTVQRHSPPPDNVPSAVASYLLYREGRVKVGHEEAGGRKNGKRTRATQPRRSAADEKPKKRGPSIDSRRDSKKESDSSPKARGRKEKQSREIHELGRGDGQQKKPPRRHGRQLRGTSPTPDEKKTEPLGRAKRSLLAQGVATVTTGGKSHRNGASSNDTQPLRRSERLRRKQGFTEPPD